MNLVSETRLAASSVASHALKENVPLHELVVLLLPNPPNEALAGLLLSHAVCCEAILGKAKVEEGRDIDIGGRELLLLFRKV